MTGISLSIATENDCRDIWSWRNHPEVRKNFFDPEPVSWENHKRWFDSRLKDKDTKIYMASSGDGKIGVIRFYPEEHVIKVSVNLNPNFFGRGLGSEIIRLGTQKLLDEMKSKTPVIAEVKKDNIISQKAFLRAGYICAKKTDEKIVYKREQND